MSELGRILKGQGSTKALRSKNVSFHLEDKEGSKNVVDSKLEDRNLDIPDEDSFKAFQNTDLRSETFLTAPTSAKLGQHLDSATVALKDATRCFESMKIMKERTSVDTTERMS